MLAGPDYQSIASAHRCDGVQRPGRVSPLTRSWHQDAADREGLLDLSQMGRICVQRKNEFGSSRSYLQRFAGDKRNDHG
jgi:hypothetical protein